MGWRTPVVLFQALARLDKVAGVLTIAFVGVGVDAAWREYLPSWVPYAAFGVLLLYGFLRASYEESRKIEHERDELKTEYEAIAQQPLAPVNEDQRQRCCRLSAELSELIRQWRQYVEGTLQPGGEINALRYEMGGDSDRSLEIRGHDNWLMEEYDERFSDKVLRLSDELAWHRCITPETRKRLESPESPKDVRHIAHRLKLICDEPDEG